MPIVAKKNALANVLSQESSHLNELILHTAIELVALQSLKDNPRNAKYHPDTQILLLAENYRKFGVTHPALVDENNMLIGGHARVAAARLLELKSFPVIRLGHLTAQEKRALALADNKLAELGSWNTEILSLELKELMTAPLN